METRLHKVFFFTVPNKMVYMFGADSVEQAMGFFFDFADQRNLDISTVIYSEATPIESDHLVEMMRAKKLGYLEAFPVNAPNNMFALSNN
jgi:hypothetical protein